MKDADLISNADTPFPFVFSKICRCTQSVSQSCVAMRVRHTHSEVHKRRSIDSLKCNRKSNSYLGIEEKEIVEEKGVLLVRNVALSITSHFPPFSLSRSLSHCQFVKSSLPELVVAYNSFLTLPVSLVFVSSNSAKTGSKLLCWKAQDVRWHKTPVPQKLNPPTPLGSKQQTHFTWRNHFALIVPILTCIQLFLFSER